MTSIRVAWPSGNLDSTPTIPSTSSTPAARPPTRKAPRSPTPTASTIHARSPRTSTVGTVLPHVEVKIVDPATGATVPTGTPGELCSRGYLVMAGYWEDADATNAAVDSGGWMHTGDLAVMDADGYVNIVGRSKDMVIRGGENAYPREIEEILFQHPQVAAAQVL